MNISDSAGPGHILGHGDELHGQSSAQYDNATMGGCNSTHLSCIACQEPASPCHVMCGSGLHLMCTDCVVPYCASLVEKGKPQVLCPVCKEKTPCVKSSRKTSVSTLVPELYGDLPIPDENKGMGNIIRETLCTFSCAGKVFGCTHVSKFTEFREHWQTCGKIPVSCGFPCCKTLSISRDGLKQHNEEFAQAHTVSLNEKAKVELGLLTQAVIRVVKIADDLGDLQNKAIDRFSRCLELEASITTRLGSVLHNLEDFKNPKFALNRSGRPISVQKLVVLTLTPNSFASSRW